MLSLCLLLAVSVFDIDESGSGELIIAFSETGCDQFYTDRCFEECDVDQCAKDCSGEFCGVKCKAYECARDCIGNDCGSECTANYCAKLCIGLRCGTNCDSVQSCAHECRGDYCGVGCKGDSCAERCSGLLCGEKCEKQYCASTCSGDSCGQKCVGEYCATGCKKSNCGDRCIGDNCAIECVTEECGRYQLYFTVEPDESYYESTTAEELTPRLEEDKTAAQMGLECTSYTEEWQCTESNKLEHYTTNEQTPTRTLTPCQWCGTACVRLDESCPTTTSTTLAVNSDLSEAYKYLKTAGDTDSLILSSDQETTELCFEECRTNDSCRAVDIEQTSTAQVKCRTFNSTIPSGGIGESDTTVFYLKPYFNYKFKNSLPDAASSSLGDATIGKL